MVIASFLNAANFVINLEIKRNEYSVSVRFFKKNLLQEFFVPPNGCNEFNERVMLPTNVLLSLELFQNSICAPGTLIKFNAVVSEL